MYCISLFCLIVDLFVTLSHSMFKGEEKKEQQQGDGQQGQQQQEEEVGGGGREGGRAEATKKRS